MKTPKPTFSRSVSMKAASLRSSRIAPRRSFCTCRFSRLVAARSLQTRGKQRMSVRCLPHSLRQAPSTSSSLTEASYCRVIWHNAGTCRKSQTCSGTTLAPAAIHSLRPAGTSFKAAARSAACLICSRHGSRKESAGHTHLSGSKSLPATNSSSKRGLYSFTAAACRVGCRVITSGKHLQCCTHFRLRGDQR